MAAKSTYQKKGEMQFAQTAKISAELITLTYGAFVHKLIKESGNSEEVNTQLDKMGYNIGCRLVDDFFAKSQGQPLCQNFRETAEVVSKQAFKMFLGVQAEIQNFDEEQKTFSLVLPENPLAEFVILPIQHNKLWYSNVLCGVIRGALEMLNMKVNCFFVKDHLRGHDINEIRVELKEIVKDRYEEEDG